MCRNRSTTTTEARGRAGENLLASDAERERAVSELRDHAATGRLDVDELEDRIARAYAARTTRELQALHLDLPAPPRDPRAGLGDHVRQYTSVMVLLVMIWALTGAGYFWPVWPMLGWGLGVAAHAWPVLTGSRARPHRAI